MNKVDYRVKSKDLINYHIWRIEWQIPHLEYRGL